MKQRSRYQTDDRYVSMSSGTVGKRESGAKDMIPDRYVARSSGTFSEREGDTEVEVPYTEVLHNQVIWYCW